MHAPEPEAEAMATDEIDSSILPNLDQVFAISGPLVKYVPRVCRCIWAEVVLHELGDVVTRNNNVAWTRLFMLAKCCLWQPRRTRGGKRHRNSTQRLPDIITDRLKRWKRGELDSLWKEYVESCRERNLQGQADPDVASVRRARRLASEGRYARACQTLTTLGVHEVSDAIWSKLRSLHPSSPAPEDPSDDLPEASYINRDAVLNSMLSFPKDTAPGASLLTPQHLKDAIMCKSPVLSARVLSVLTSVVNLLASGEATRDIARFMAGGGLTPLRKPDNEVRPIAVGETLRRLVGKCLVRHEEIAPHMEGVFLPSQVGVGISGGAEAVAHAVSRLVGEYGHDPSLALLKIDFENAFNSVSRAALLEAVLAEFPSLARWAWWCYGEHSQLWAGGRVIESQSGTQQGDPLGPLFFCLLLRRVTAEICHRWPDLKLHVWYLDDGTLVGDRESLKQILDFLRSSIVRDLGLIINDRKCELWWPTGDVSFSGFPAPVKRQPPEGVEILKVPIGSDNFICEKLRERAQKVANAVARLERLEDAHVEFTILRACLGSCKFNYVLRGICPSTAVINVLQEIDDSMRLALEHLLHCSISDGAWLQAGLASKDGGLGVRHLASIAHPAYIGSSINSAPLVSTLLGCNHFVTPRLQSAASELLARVDEVAPDSISGALRTIGLTPLLSIQYARSMPCRAQAWLQGSVDSWSWAEMHAQASGQERDRLDAVRRPHAGAWLSAFPCRALGLWIPSQEFIVSAKLWLGTIDQQDTKILRRTGVGMYGRHNAIRDVIYEVGNAARLRPCREVAVDSSGQRPADVFFPDWSRGRPLAVDVTVTHFSQASSQRNADLSFSASERAAHAKVIAKESL